MTTSNFDGKHLLEDVKVGYPDYSAILNTFIQVVVATRLQKFARSQAPDTGRKNRVLQLRDENHFTIHFRILVIPRPRLIGSGRRS